MALDAGLSYNRAKQIAIDHIRKQSDIPIPGRDPAIIESETIEKEWGWVVYWNTSLFLDTGDYEHAIWGAPPLCINRADGSVKPLEGAKPFEREIRTYEREIGQRPWWKRW